MNKLKKQTNKKPQKTKARQLQFFPPFLQPQNIYVSLTHLSNRDGAWGKNSSYLCGNKGGQGAGTGARGGGFWVGQSRSLSIHVRTPKGLGDEPLKLCELLVTRILN